MKKIIISSLVTLAVSAVLYGGDLSRTEESSKGEGCGCGNNSENKGASMEYPLKEKIAINQKHFNLEKGNVVAQGYDVVAYYSGNPIEGSENHISKYEGVIYYFKDEKNKNIFDSDPEKYTPAYGGWCAYAMAENKGKKVDINPETYKIINGKLYLFYNAFFNNTLEKWNKGDEKEFLKKADDYWRKYITPKELKKQAEKAG